VGVIPKTNIGQLEQAVAFYVDLLIAVDQNVGDGWVLQQRLERPQAKYLVEDLFGDLLAFERAKQRLFAVDEGDDGLPHLATNPLVVNGGERLEIDLLQQLAVQRELQLLVLGAQGVLVPRGVA
jgi:hypothetical protein